MTWHIGASGCALALDTPQIFVASHQGEPIYDGEYLIVTAGDGLTVNGSAQTAEENGAFVFQAGAGTMTLESTGARTVTRTVLGRTTVQCPGTIDNTGGTDVTSALTTWLNSLDPGTKVTFPADSTYLIQGTVVLTNLVHLMIDGTGASFKTTDIFGDGQYTSCLNWTPNTVYNAGQLVVNDGDGSLYTANADFTSGATFTAANWTKITPPTSARTRAHFRVNNCRNPVFANLSFVGPHPAAASYAALLEAQNFIDFDPASDMSVGAAIYNCTATRIFGDFVYWGNNTRYTVVQWNTFSVTGRQGMSPCFCFHTYILANTVTNLRRAFIDMEPDVDGWLADTVVVARNQVGWHQLTFIAAGSSHSSVNNVWVVDNSDTVNDIGNNGGTAFSIIGNLSNPNRKTNWTFSRNAFGAEYGSSSGGAVDFMNVDGVTATGNTVPLQSGRSVYAFQLESCTGYSVSGNTVTGGAGEVEYV